jgi:hypothetical protein
MGISKCNHGKNDDTIEDRKVANVVDLMTLMYPDKHPHGMDEMSKSGIPGSCLEQMTVYASRSSFVKLMAIFLCTTLAVTRQWPQR